ncbi:hemolysin family protein [Streptomyces sp. NPDC004749]
MTEVLLLLVAVLLSLACGAFVAAEFSLTTVERGELERAAERGERGAAGAMKAVRNLTFQLSGAQLGITVTNLVVGMVSEPSIATLLRGPVEAVGLSPSVASSVALVIGTALSTVFLMVVGELVPKNWAISSPLAVAKVVATPQRCFTAAFRPFISHLNSTANRIVRGFGMEPTEELASARSPQELVALARHSAKEGALEADTAELFVRTLSLAALTAENVMTPRVRVMALDVRATAEDVANATRATGLSRFPVYRDSLDRVIGVAHIKDVLPIPVESRPRRAVAELLHEPLLVPETLTVDRLLDRLTGGGTLAVVIDEYGGTAGVVTLEDIVEEVVGEVRDEHDPQEASGLVRVGEDAEGRTLWSADGAARADQLVAVGLRMPEGPYETLAGLMATELGRIPAEGDRVDLAGWRFEVTEVARRRAERVLLRAPLAMDGTTGADGVDRGGKASGGTDTNGPVPGGPVPGGAAPGSTAPGGAGPNRADTNGTAPGGGEAP